MPLDLANDVRPRVGGQRAAELRIKVIDRLHQAHVPNLHQVLDSLRQKAVPPYAGPDQAPVAGHQLCGSRIAPFAAAGQRTNDCQ